jgi:S-DNA-T family DNA segregation ATPase FtsK/SpoIIIE
VARRILVHLKRLEMGLYEGIPHLLTPVITEPRKASNALRNAVLEMERRLLLLAAQGVRNIEQYNRKFRQLQNEPISLFGDSEEGVEDLEPLPCILILIDELADLMMVEGHNLEQPVIRLEQMARAVGMHLAPATRVDSRTVLDVKRAKHLPGRGDMLFLPRV